MKASGIGLDAFIFINDKTIVQKSRICMSLYEREIEKHKGFIWKDVNYIDKSG